MKVFCIDDDIVTLMITRRFLSKVGIEDVLTAEDGKEAIEFLLNNELYVPDFIFLDINMPVMNGWDFLNQFEKHLTKYQNTKVYIVSSSIDPGDPEKAMSYNSVVGFIPKPLSLETIKDVFQL